MYRRICRKKLMFLDSESISKKVCTEYFAILLKFHENKEKYQKLLILLRCFSSVTRHLNRYLLEERAVFNYKCETPQELVSPKRRFRISQRHIPDIQMFCLPVGNSKKKKKKLKVFYSCFGL